MIRIAVIVETALGAGVGRRRGAMPVPLEFDAAVGPAIEAGFGGGANRRGLELGRSVGSENMSAAPGFVWSTVGDVASGFAASAADDGICLRMGRWGRMRPCGSAGPFDERSVVSSGRRLG